MNKLVSSTDIERRGFDWAYADTYETSEDPIIVNTDLSGGPGVHWIVVVQLSDGPYAYDPLGPRNDRRASDGTSVKQYFKGLRWFPYTSQLGSSDHCGGFALYIAGLIRSMMKKKPLTSKDVDRLIVSEFGKSADHGDEVRLDGGLM